MNDLRVALSGSLASLPGVQESPYVLENPTPPCAEVEPAPIKYDLAMQRGLDQWRFIVRVFVGASTDIGSQVRLDEFLDPTGPMSVKTLLEADRSLGGACDSMQVTGCSGYKVYHSARAGTVSLGAEWTVEIYVSN